MRPAFYFDDNIAMKPVVAALRQAEIVVVTADEAGNRGADDEAHLSYAAAHGLVLVTADEGDFSVLHWSWVSAGRLHSGIVLVRQRTSIGEQIRALERLCGELPADGLRGSLVYLTRFM